VTTRRSILTAGASATLLPTLMPTIALANDSVKPRANSVLNNPESLIPVTPIDRLTGFMRLFVGLRGKCVFTNEGIIYGKSDKEMAKPLYGFLAVLEVRVSEVEPGIYRSEQKEALVCTDLVTRMPLKNFINPYTNEKLIPVGYVSPNNVYFFDVTGSYTRALPKERSGIKQLDWRTSSTDIWVTESRFNSFPSSITEKEFPRAFSGDIRHSVDILTYRAKAVDFADASMASVPSTLTMVSDTPWPLWLMMGKRPGGAIWHGFGQKYRQLSDLPDVNRRAVDMAYAGFLDDPWGFASAEWGTAAQLRRLRAQGLLDAPKEIK
jgi:Protein of unknown function (DUF1838)